VLIEGAWTNSPLAIESMDDRYWRSPRLRNAVAACAACVDLRMAVRTVAPLWKLSVPAIGTNTNRKPLMSESYTLPTKPEGMVATLRERSHD
jgi:hypothetical protein